MLVALYSAQKDYAKTGDKDLQDLLVDILVERASHSNRDIRQITLDESLAVATKLTVEQMDALTLNFLLAETMNNSLGTLASLKNYLEKDFLPFLRTQVPGNSTYRHIEYSGCGTILQFGQRPKLEQIFKERYTGLFSKGFTEEDATTKLGEITPFRSVLIPCLRNASKLQILALNAEQITEHFKRLGVVDKHDEFKSLLESSTMETERIREAVVALCPEIEKLFSLWNDSGLSKLTLTTVGIAIAQANYRRRTGLTLDLSIWVK